LLRKERCVSQAENAPNIVLDLGRRPLMELKSLSHHPSRIERRMPFSSFFFLLSTLSTSQFPALPAFRLSVGHNSAIVGYRHFFFSTNWALVLGLFSHVYAVHVWYIDVVWRLFAYNNHSHFVRELLRFFICVVVVGVCHKNWNVMGVFTRWSKHEANMTQKIKQTSSKH